MHVPSKDTIAALEVLRKPFYSSFPKACSQHVLLLATLQKLPKFQILS